MKQHGLLLSPPMARARYRRIKKQTRRLITLHTSNIDGHGSRVPYQVVWDAFDLSKAFIDGGPSPAGNAGPYLKAPLTWAGITDHTTHRIYPRVQPGDTIWWKETMKVMHTDSLRYYPEYNDGRPVEEVDPHEEEFHIRIPIYRATDHDITLVYEDDDEADHPVPWTPSMLMPRKWCRMQDVVTAVRPERLSSITDADCLAEGIDQLEDGQGGMRFGIGDICGDAGGDGWPFDQWCATPREAYFKLLASLHGQALVDSDPWLWVYTWE